MMALIYMVLVALHVWHNYTIRKNRLKVHDYRDIEKVPEILKYAAATLIVTVLTMLIFNVSWYYNLALSLTARCAFFDVPFNLLTGKTWNYENPKGKSWFDKLELKTGISFEYRLVIYFALFLLTARFLA